MIQMLRFGHKVDEGYQIERHKWAKPQEFYPKFEKLKN